MKNGEPVVHPSAYGATLGAEIDPPRMLSEDRSVKLHIHTARLWEILKPFLPEEFDLDLLKIGRFIEAMAQKVGEAVKVNDQHVAEQNQEIGDLRRELEEARWHRNFAESELARERLTHEKTRAKPFDEEDDDEHPPTVYKDIV